MNEYTMITFCWVNKLFQTPSGDITILQDASLLVNQWDFIALMWPSWSGKTTVLNLIAWLEDFEQWEILVNTVNIKELNNDKKTIFRGKTISFVFQQFHLLPQLTVEENIDLVIQLNNLERRFETGDILEKVWLWWRGNIYPTTLSWWEQQRVALARAFVAKTPILLADEPTWNLDQKTASTIMKLMRSLHDEVWNTIIMITHDQKIAQYADATYSLQEFTFSKQ